jgi:plastocyanin
VNKNLTLLITLIAALSFSRIASAAALTGKAVFDGTPPAAEKMKADADPKCKLAHPDGIASDGVIVNANGTLKNVFVYVKEGLSGKKFPAPKDAVVFDQKGCVYTPKVFGVQVGQPVEIINSDDTLHNVHSLSTKSAQFNLGMPIKGMKLKKSFTAPEVMVKIKCEVHPWMAAYAGVLDHPFYAVSGEDGSFQIKDLPPGDYTIEAWHEKLGTQTQSVKVASDSDAPTAEFHFKG